MCEFLTVTTHAQQAMRHSTSAAAVEQARAKPKAHTQGNNLTRATNSTPLQEVAPNENLKQPLANHKQNWLNSNTELGTCAVEKQTDVFRNPGAFGGFRTPSLVHNKPAHMRPGVGHWATAA